MKPLLPKPAVGSHLAVAEQLAQGLVDEWLFNEGRGDKAHDSSLFRNHGTLTGPTWVGEGLNFVPGNNDFVQMQNVVEPDAAVGTVIVRFRANTLHTGTLFHTADSSSGNIIGLGMRVGAGGVGEVFMRFGGGSSFNVAQDTDNVIYAPGQWVTVAIAQDGSGYIYCVDGILQPMSDAFGQTSQDLTAWNAAVAGLDRTRIGREADLTDGFTFDGVISYVSTHNRAMSASEIRQATIRIQKLTHPDPTIAQWAASQEVVAPSGIVVLRRRRECA